MSVSVVVVQTAVPLHYQSNPCSLCCSAVAPIDEGLEVKVGEVIEESNLGSRSTRCSKRTVRMKTRNRRVC